MKTRLLTAIILFSFFCLLAVPVLAGEGDSDAPRNLIAVISARQGNPGAALTVSGSGADPSLAVYVTLSPRATSSEGAFVTLNVSPAADGSFSTQMTVPADVPDGVYAVRAEQFTGNGGVLQYYWQAFTVGSGGGATVANILPETGASETGTPWVRSIAVLGLALIFGLVLRGVWGLIQARA